jgi:hypothetical protein
MLNEILFTNVKRYDFLIEALEQMKWEGTKREIDAAVNYNLVVRNSYIKTAYETEKKCSTLIAYHLWHIPAKFHNFSKIYFISH